MPKSEKDDNELTMYQLHCRYCILHGMSMEEASKAWNEHFKGKYTDREEFFNSLLSWLLSEKRELKE